MTTLETFTVAGEDEDYVIYIDVDDQGWAYLKQDDDWVAFNQSEMRALAECLLRAAEKIQ